MTALLDFLLARIVEDEEAAHAAEATEWSTTRHRNVKAVDDGLIAAVGTHSAAHIARHDPQRVLAECRAKRRIIRLATEADRAPRFAVPTAPEEARAFTLDAVVRALAAVYEDHPDYRPEWGGDWY